MGTINPLGHTVADTWAAIKAGQSGIARITHFDPTSFGSQIAGEVKNYDLAAHFSAEHMKDAKKMDPFVHYAAAATNEAVRQANIASIIATDPYKVGICIGSGIGGLQSQQKNGAGLAARGPKGVSPMYVPAMLGDICVGFMSMIHGMKGPNLATQTACATANHALAVSYLMIKHGMIDVCVAGGTEAGVCEISVAGFSNMRALSTRNDDPTRASRPYDTARDGFVIAEGAGVLVLEEYEHAVRRGAPILAELVGIGMSGDAYDIVQPDPQGRGALHSMKMACADAGLKPTAINYINAHGTSTPLGDIAESMAISQLVEGKVDNLNVGSTKSMHGHLLGATAGIEAIITICAMNENHVPANINIDNFDERIPLPAEIINTKSVNKDIKYALSNSFGFGGHNSTVIFGKV